MLSCEWSKWTPEELVTGDSAGTVHLWSLSEHSGRSGADAEGEEWAGLPAPVDAVTPKGATARRLVPLRAFYAPHNAGVPAASCAALAVNFSPADRDVLAAASCDGCLRLWHRGRTRALAEVACSTLGTRPVSVVPSFDGQSVLVAPESGAVEQLMVLSGQSNAIWEQPKGAPAATLRLDSSTVVNEGGKLLQIVAVGSSTGQVSLAGAVNGAPIATRIRAKRRATGAAITLRAAPPLLPTDLGRTKPGQVDVGLNRVTEVRLQRCERVHALARNQCNKMLLSVGLADGRVLCYTLDVDGWCNKQLAAVQR